jgi:hypothetical protein
MELNMLGANSMSVTDEERNVLEEYCFSVQGFHDSLKGLSSAVEEAWNRCEKARRACEELRTAREREKTQRNVPCSSVSCPERYRLQERWAAATESYHDALSSISPSSKVLGEREECERIERARNTCNYAFKLLDDHERTHGCRQNVLKGSANAKSA